MNERKFHKLIEKQNTEEKKAVWRKIQAELEPYRKSEKKPFFVRYKKWVVTFAACFVCLAIVIPVSLRYIALNKKVESGFDDQPRYCTSDEYEIVTVSQTLKDYAEENNESFLYLDWYQNSLSCETKHYVDKSTAEVLCLKESIINGETGDDVQLYIIKNNIIMDFIDENLKTFNNIQMVYDVSVQWLMTNIEAKAYFEYQDYCYYLYIYYPMSEQTIFDIVQQMLETAA